MRKEIFHHRVPDTDRIDEADFEIFGYVVVLSFANKKGKENKDDGTVNWEDDTVKKVQEIQNSAHTPKVKDIGIIAAIRNKGKKKKGN